MSNVKRQVQEILKRLPEDCSVEDVQYTCTSLKKFVAGSSRRRAGSLSRKARPRSGLKNGSSSSLAGSSAGRFGCYRRPTLCAP